MYAMYIAVFPHRNFVVFDLIQLNMSTDKEEEKNGELTIQKISGDLESESGFSKI